jgi:hypothetical protein
MRRRQLRNSLLKIVEANRLDEIRLRAGSESLL